MRYRKRNDGKRGRDEREKNKMIGEKPKMKLRDKKEQRTKAK